MSNSIAIRLKINDVTRTLGTPVKPQAGHLRSGV